MAEAGIGDEFINLRFCNHIKNLGMNPIWLTERQDLQRIFIDNGITTITNINQLKPKNYYWTHSMDIPVYLNLEYKDLWNGPYLKANRKFIEKFKLSKNKINVGLRWQGNSEYDHDLHRSIPIKDIIPLFDQNKYQLHSLQKDTGLEDIEGLNVIDYSNKLETFEDTLGLIENLDLIITSCTSVAHASAAMGKQTIIFTPISAYYVWSHSMKQSPWYGDNVIILRQQKPRIWDSPIQELEKILSNRYK